MVFKRKESFFLDLSGGDQTGAKEPVPVQVAISEPPAPTDTGSENEIPVAPAEAELQPGVSQTPAPAARAEVTQPVVTTAEAIAAELRTAQEALPPPTLVTYAPECLNPANALPKRRRQPGANMTLFKDMAAGMFRN